MDKKWPVLISALKELDCCSRCILLFLGVDMSENSTLSYTNPDEKLVQTAK